MIGADGGYDALVPGAAYVYERNSGGSDNWGEVKKLVPSDGLAGDAFGFAVSGFKDTIAVSAYLDDDNGDQSGSVYLYGRDKGGDSNWGQLRIIKPSDGAADDRFGRSLALSDATLVVGSFKDDDGGVDAGSAYVFARDQFNNWRELIKLQAPDPSANDRFGRGTAIGNGFRILVGADFVDEVDAGTNVGAAYVYDIPPRVSQLQFGDVDLFSGDETMVRSAEFNLRFSSPVSNPFGDGQVPGDVTDTSNYRLISSGLDGVIESNVNDGCLMGLQGDDVSIEINSVSYVSNVRVASVSVNDGVSLPLGDYSLLVCGSTQSSIRNSDAMPLDGDIDGAAGGDYVLNFTLSPSSATDEMCFPVRSKNNSLAHVCL